MRYRCGQCAEPLGTGTALTQIWEAHQKICFGYDNDDEEEPQIVAELLTDNTTAPESIAELLAECEIIERSERCGKALAANDRSCALPKGHEPVCRAPTAIGRR